MQKIQISSECDVIEARIAARQVAETKSFSLLGKTYVAAAVSELGERMVEFGGAEVQIGTIGDGGRRGVRCNFNFTLPRGIKIDIPESHTASDPTGPFSSVRVLLDHMFLRPGDTPRNWDMEIIKWR